MKVTLTTPLRRSLSRTPHPQRFVSRNRPVEHWVRHSRRGVHFVDWRLKVVHVRGSRGDLPRVFVVDPPRIHRSHVNIMLLRELRRTRSRHHVQRGFGHVPLLVVLGFVAVKCILHRADQLRAVAPTAPFMALHVPIDPDLFRDTIRKHGDPKSSPVTAEGDGHVALPRLGIFSHPDRVLENGGFGGIQRREEG